MQRKTVFLVVLLATALGAQSSPPDKEEQATIQRVKKVLASVIDHNLPKVTLDYFLRYESNGAEIHWEVNDCGEQSGNPAVDSGRDFPICVEADFELDHRSVSVSIAVGTVKTGPSSVPSLYYANVSDPDGSNHPINRLSALPMALHRPLRREPRDSPNSAGARS